MDTTANLPFQCDVFDQKLLNENDLKDYLKYEVIDRLV